MSPAAYLGLSGAEAGDDEAALWRLAHALRETVRSPETAREWMRRPIPGLDGRRPIDLLVAGRSDDLVSLLRRVDQGQGS